MKNVIHIKPPSQVSLLSTIASGEPGIATDYDHSGKRTPFSRWLAINRKRHGVRFRHTTKDVEKVALNAAELSGEETFAAVNTSDSGPLTYYKGGKQVSQSEVPNLPKHHYKIWRR